MLTHLLDLVFPRRSLTGELGSFVTSHERQLLLGTPVIKTKGQLSQMGVEHLDHLIAARRYHASPLLRTALHALKYRRMTALHPELAGLLYEATPLLGDLEGVVLCPVPLHWRRLFFRGFNQAELLSNALSQAFDVPSAKLLRRTRSTGFQSWRNAVDRRSAMQGAFCFTARHDVPQYVVLIDDVATTGSTLDACAKELKEHGVARVSGLVVALG